jgi:TPP-dependent pyruvate/acetoin dehydrogenase alpha subunit
MLDCETYRMGGYSSHFGEPRSGIEDDLAHWRTRDPIAQIEDWLERHGGMSKRALAAIRSEEADAISAAWEKAKRGASRGNAPRR